MNSTPSITHPHRSIPFFGLAAFACIALAGCSFSPSPVILDDDAGAPSDSAVVPPDLTPGDLATGCADDKGCTGGKHCDPGSHQCFDCVTDAQCGDGLSCRNHQCLPGCSAQHGCGDAGLCEGDAGTCVACLTAPDTCAAGSYCRAADHTCQTGCKVDGDCPLGKICTQNQCADGCTAMHGCPMPKDCCSGTCTDLNSDVANCGACGKMCANGQGCCASACSDPMSDPMNCGGCGKLCPAIQNGSASCVMGGCGRGACNMGFAHCTGNANACETNIAIDVNNCGACSKLCPAPANGVPGCTAGSCVIASCNMGFGDCDLMLGNGCEANLTTDLKNCGACANACPAIMNGAPGCVMGTCGIATCIMPFADCDKNAPNGCESNTQIDIANCGGCNKPCGAIANGLPGCAGGMCTVAACNKGFGDCDMMVVNGCESNFATDVKNCSGCGKPCAAVPNGTGACAMGTCTIGSCKMGFADCDKQVPNGCEINTDSDVKNCGSCGNICPAVAHGTGACVGGKCAIASCNNGYADCNLTVADGCEANLGTDAKNCGVCGNSCSGSCGTSVVASFATKPANWTFNGSAVYDANFKSGVLTDTNNNNEAGTIIFNDKIVVDRFTLDFDFQISAGSGADGMAFMIQQTGATAVGGTGSGFGVTGLSGYAVEFDTFNNGVLCGDADANHVGIDDLKPYISCNAPTPLKAPR